MRANPLVCVEVDEVAAHDLWVSVIAFGRYEELSKPPGSDGARLRAPERPRPVVELRPAWSADSHHYRCDDEREKAWQIFQTHPMSWEPGLTAWAARTHRDPTKRFIPVYYRIRIERVTGHEATPAAKDTISSALPAPPAGRWGRLCKMLTRRVRRQVKCGWRDWEKG